MVGPGRGPGARPPGGARPAGRSTRSARPVARSRGGGEPSTTTGATNATTATRARTGARRGSFTGRAAVLALVLGVLAVSYAYPLRTWYDQHTTRAALEHEAAELRSAVADLQTELRLWDDPAYVRARARERLNFVMPGEVGYVVVDESGDTEPGPADRPGGVTVIDEGPWYSRLWASVDAADAVPPEGAG